MGGIGGCGEIKKMTGSSASANERAKYIILVHTVQLLIIKAQILGRMISSGLSDVVIASVQSDKTCLKKFMIIMNKIARNDGS